MRGTGPETHEENSGPRRALGLLSGEWTSMVPRNPHALHGGTCRAGESQRGLPGIGKTMPTRTLRGMERGGLLPRRVFDVVPSLVERGLAPVGRGFLETVEMLHERGRVHANALDRLGPRPRSRRRRSTPSGSG